MGVCEEEGIRPGVTCILSELASLLGAAYIGASGVWYSIVIAFHSILIRRVYCVLVFGALGDLVFIALWCTILYGHSNIAEDRQTKT